MVGRLGGDDYHVGQSVEAGNVLLRVVAGLVHAAGVQEGKERGLGGGELVLAGETGAGPETLANLGVIGTSEVFDDGGLAALGLAEQPEHGHGGVAAQVFETLLELVVAGLGGENTLELLEHAKGPP